MKDIQLQANFKPVSLTLQIEHTNGKLVEVSLACWAQVGANAFRHDIWWQDMPQSWRDHAQQLIDEAITTLMTSTAVQSDSAPVAKSVTEVTPEAIP